jgi:hypothetical protein
MGTASHEAKVTSSNFSSPLLCGHVKERKKKEKKKRKVSDLI